MVTFIDCLIEQEGKAKERRKRRRRKEEKKWEKWGSYREPQILMSQHGTCQITHAGSSMRAQETFSEVLQCACGKFQACTVSFAYARREVSLVSCMSGLAYDSTPPFFKAECCGPYCTARSSVSDR